MPGPIGGVSLHKSLHYGRLTKSNISVGSAYLNNLKKSFVENIVHIVLHAVPSYWCKIAENCKKDPLSCNRQLLSPHGTGMFQSINSRSLTRADENGSGDIDNSFG